MATPEAAGLRHAFFSERRALTLPQAVAEVAVDPVRTLGIWGADGAAADLAHQALTAGLRVVIGAPDRANLVAALEVIAARQELAVSQGRQSAETRDADWSRLVSTLSLQTLDGADLVMCLPPGDVALGVEGPLVGVIGAATAAHPVGVTVAAGRAALAEVSQAPGAPIAAVARMVGLARQLGWRAVLVGPGGPVELHLRAALVQAVAALEDEGQSGDLITAALAASGIGGGVLTTLPAMPRGGAAIVAVCLAALAAEGARMVADGRVRSPASVDAVALLAGIVPRWLGGPMFQADLRGLMVMRAELRRLAQKSAVFAPAPLFDDLIAEGRLFGSLT